MQLVANRLQLFPQPYKPINVDPTTFLGIEIGGTKLQVVQGTAGGSLLSAHRFAVDRQAGAAGIRKILDGVLSDYLGQDITAVGVGFGGPVNHHTGRIATSFQVAGWSGFDLAAWLETKMQVPVFVDNDANVAALGEAVYGAGADHRVVLYLTLGSGVGGGLVVEQQLYHGALPGEVEIGHIRLDRNGTTLEQCCSGWAVDARIRKAVAAHPGGVLARLVGNNTTAEARFLDAALEAGDPVAQAIWDETISNLAYGLSHAIHLLHPDVLVLGGGLSLVGNRLAQSLADALPQHLMPAFAPGPPVVLAQLKEQAVPVGCLVLCSQKIQTLKWQ